MGQLRKVMEVRKWSEQQPPFSWKRTARVARMANFLARQEDQGGEDEAAELLKQWGRATPKYLSARVGVCFWVFFYWDS